MSKHETIARRLIDEVWNSGKYDALSQLATPDLINHDQMNPTKGTDEFATMVKKYRNAFPDLHQQVDDLFSSGDRVVVRMTGTGTHRGPLEEIPATGRKVKVGAIAIFRMKGDRVAECFVNWDALGLMQQLGVVTLPGTARGASA